MKIGPRNDSFAEQFSSDRITKECASIILSLSLSIMLSMYMRIIIIIIIIIKYS